MLFNRHGAMMLFHSIETAENEATINTKRLALARIHHTYSYENSVAYFSIH
ncbi:MAG: hypothetical protein ACFFC7_33210 [Candidatus Hermodarchaeota archaeon]